MEFIIGNKRYNTDKSEFITRYKIGSTEKTLYVTAKGNYFFTVTEEELWVKAAPETMS